MSARFAALALVGLAALAYLAQANPAPLITPGDAVAWEGQSVALRGIVRDRRVNDGVARFDVVLDGHAIAVRFEGPAPLDGTSVHVAGRLARFSGALTLLADEVKPVALDAALSVSLAALARDPTLWQDRQVTVQGTVDGGRLRGDGHAITLGEGSWPKSGAVTATVLLNYDAACACHRLDRVQPWTS